MLADADGVVGKDVRAALRAAARFQGEREKVEATFFAVGMMADGGTAAAADQERDAEESDQKADDGHGRTFEKPGDPSRGVNRLYAARGDCRRK